MLRGSCRRNILVLISDLGFELGAYTLPTRPRHLQIENNYTLHIEKNINKLPLFLFENCPDFFGHSPYVVKAVL